MRSVEERLSILGGAVVVGSGVLWNVPAINSIAALAGIVALILIVSRLGYARAFWNSLIAFLLASGIGSLTNGYPEGLYSGIVYGILVVAPAFLMGWACRKFHEPHFVVGFGLIPYAIFLLAMAYFYAELMRNPEFYISGFKSEIELAINSNPDLLKLLKQNYGADNNVVDTFLTELGNFVKEVLKILPGAIMTLMLGVIVFSFSIAGHLAAKMGIIISRFRPYYQWKASGWWLLPTIAGLIPVVFRMEELWFYTGINILIVTGHVYMVIGLAIMEAFFKRALVQTPIKIIFYLILILAGPISMVFLAILGLSDTKFDFKREIEEFENKE